MKLLLGKPLLLGSVQRDLFCKFCSVSLDVDKAVNVTANLDGRRLDATVCTTCFDKSSLKNLREKCTDVQILDGRKF